MRNRLQLVKYTGENLAGATAVSFFSRLETWKGNPGNNIANVHKGRVCF